MKGCIKNIMPGWAHAFKRAVAPGEEIPLDELYKAYGEKHNLAEGDEFVAWIRDVKLNDPNRWKIILKEEVVEEVVPDEKAQGLVTPMVPKDMDVMDIVEMSVRNAKDILPKITNIKLLKYALKEADGRSGKDSLCRILRKRISTLGVTSRI